MQAPDKPTTPISERTDDIVGWILRQTHKAAEAGKLSIWVIYDHPDDCPHEFCARRHEVPGKGTQDVIVFELEGLRLFFRTAGLVCVCRQEGDDKVIVESWI